LTRPISTERLAISSMSSPIRTRNIFAMFLYGLIQVENLWLEHLLAAEASNWRVKPLARSPAFLISSM
jgi:hypothetical protein